MSKQLQEFAKEKMEFKLKVRYDQEPTTLIPTAELISNDLRLKVKEHNSNILFETHKKAWVVEQLDLSDQEQMSTIIQQTTTGAWIGFECVHPKDVVIKQTFIETSRANRDIKIMLYPMYFIIGIVIATEIWLIWKTLIKKDIIILTKNDWIIIAIAMIAIIGWFTYIFHKMRNMKLHEAYFEIKSLEYTKVDTYDFYFKVKRSTGGTFTLRYTLTLQVFKGNFFHPDLPRREKKSATTKQENLQDLNTIENLKEELKIANDTLLVLREKEHELFVALDSLKKEQTKHYLKNVSDELTIKKPKDNDIVNPLVIDELKSLDQDIILLREKSALELDEQITTTQKDLTDLRTKIAAQKKNFEEKQQQLQQQLLEAIEGVYIFNPERDKLAQIQELLNADQIAKKYRSQNADLRNIVLNLKQAISGLYDTNYQMQESFNQRVAEESARRTNTDYSYEIVAGSQADIALSEEATQKQKQRRSSSGGFSIDVVRLLMTALVFLGGLAATIYGIIKIVEYFSLIHPIIALLIILAMILLVVALIWLANKVMARVTATDTSMRLT